MRFAKNKASIQVKSHQGVKPKSR